MKRLFLLFVYFFWTALPTAADTVQIHTEIPGVQQVTSPGGLVENFYQFGLMFGGLLAFGAIVYGGLKYTLAAGNPEKQRDGKDNIEQALIGLLLLICAYVVLNFINPKLTNLSLDVSGLSAPPPQQTPAAQPPYALQGSSPTGTLQGPPLYGDQSRINNVAPPFTPTH